LYLRSKVGASAFVIELIILNLATPFMISLIMFSVVIKFSGSPVKSSVYQQKLKLLKIAVLIWSLARVLRGVGGIFESKLFYGIMMGLSDEKYSNFFIPMMLIVIFLVIEIAPFLFVLDWHFMEIFIIKAFPLATTEPLFEHQGTHNLSYLSMTSQRDASQNIYNTMGHE